VTAYRPVICVANEEERKVADSKKAEVAELIKQPVAVEIGDAKTFRPICKGS
jgi:peptide methionine sulfoxide reductase MsrA